MKRSKLVRFHLALWVDKASNALQEAIERRTAAITYRIGRAGVILGNAIMPEDEWVEAAKQLLNVRESKPSEPSK